MDEWCHIPHITTPKAPTQEVLTPAYMGQVQRGVQGEARECRCRGGEEKGVQGDVRRGGGEVRRKGCRGCEERWRGGERVCTNNQFKETIIVTYLINTSGLHPWMGGNLNRSIPQVNALW